MEFPASSPYVLAVGATEIQAPCAAFPSSIGSTAAWCNGNTLGRLSTQYGLSVPSGYSSNVPLQCYNPAAASTEQAVSININTPSAGSTFNSGGRLLALLRALELRRLPVAGHQHVAGHRRRVHAAARRLL